MRLTRLLFVLLLTAVTARASLTDADVDEAIAMGKQGAAPLVHVGTSRDFGVSIGGPLARVALAASRATKRFQSFERTDVDSALRARKFVVVVLSNPAGRYLAPVHIAVQAKDAASGVIQPSAEDGDVDSMLPGRQATFDRLPDGDFDVVVATTETPQRFTVAAADRAKIR